MDKIVIDFEGLKKSHWSEKELQNATVITAFIQHLMNNHDFDYVLKTHGNDPYVQHSRGIADSMSGLIENIRGLTKRFPDYTYDVKRILVDGDYVTFHSHATTNRNHRGNDRKGFNIIDTWKVVDGQIVEHWDAIQPMDGLMRLYMWLVGGAIRNQNGVYQEIMR